MEIGDAKMNSQTIEKSNQGKKESRDTILTFRIPLFSYDFSRISVSRDGLSGHLIRQMAAME